MQLFKSVRDSSETREQSGSDVWISLTRGINITCNLIKMQNSWAPPRSTESGGWGLKLWLTSWEVHLTQASAGEPASVGHSNACSQASAGPALLTPLGNALHTDLAPTSPLNAVHGGGGLPGEHDAEWGYEVKNQRPTSWTCHTLAGPSHTYWVRNSGSGGAPRNLVP